MLSAKERNFTLNTMITQTRNTFITVAFIIKLWADEARFGGIVIQLILIVIILKDSLKYNIVYMEENKRIKQFLKSVKIDL